MLRSIAFAIFWVTVGCGSDVGGGDAAPVAVEDFTLRFSEAFCAGLFNCCEDPMDVWEEGTPPETEEECVSWFLSFEDGPREAMEDIREAVEAGRVAYDARAAGACFEAIPTAFCDNVPPPSCQRFTTGLVENGDPCTRRSECADGHCHMGRCQAFIAEGEPCGADNICADGLWCTGEGVCAPRKSDGESCTSPHECTSLRCDASGMCVPPPAVDLCDDTDPLFEG